jgi:hypothetical protein
MLACSPHATYSCHKKRLQTYITGGGFHLAEGSHCSARSQQLYLLTVALVSCHLQRSEAILQSAARCRPFKSQELYVLQVQGSEAALQRAPTGCLV